MQKIESNAKPLAKAEISKHCMINHGVIAGENASFKNINFNVDKEEYKPYMHAAIVSLVIHVSFVFMGVLFDGHNVYATLAMNIAAMMVYIAMAFFGFMAGHKYKQSTGDNLWDFKRKK